MAGKVKKFLYIDDGKKFAGMMLLDGIVVQTAPSLFYLLGNSEDSVRRMCATNFWSIEELPMKDSICPHCRLGQLVEIAPDEPWHTWYLICPSCNSTYNKPPIGLNE
jgi:hypothetical protein